MVSFAAAAVAVLLGSVGVANAATAEEWQNRTIYQLLTDRFARTDLSTTAPCAPGVADYCGGSWQGIVGELDYIQGMGFDAIWISPVTKNVDDPARSYHGYSQVDLYQLNEHFGTPDDLKALADALHDRGMYLMVDVVANHFGWDGEASDIDYSTFNPFNQQGYFHTTPICFIEDYTNQTEVETCWLGTEDFPLPDLATTVDFVRTSYQTWISQLVSNYSIDGLRIDTVKHVEKDFWPLFQSAAGVYAVGEVADGDVPYACDYQNYVDGILNYPIYYQLTQFLQSPVNVSTDFVNVINYMQTECKDVQLLGSFSENHDQPRFLSLNPDLTADRNLITYTILADGIPIIYAGQEQSYNGTSDPYNREATWLSGYNTNATLYTFTTSLNTIRKTAISTDSTYLNSTNTVVYSDSHSLALQKGGVVAVYNNNGGNAGEYSLTVTTQLTAGTEMQEVLACGGSSVTVGDDGSLSVSVVGGEPLVFMSKSSLAGSGICGL